MATTPVYALRYQALTDAPHGPNLGQNLAEDVEAELARIDGVLGGRGRIASATLTTSPAATSSEVVAYTLTYTAVVGRRYRLLWNGGYKSSAAGDAVTFRMRWASGASLTAAGTQFRIQAMNVAPSVALTTLPICLVGEATGIPAGQTTIGLTFVRSAGSGTITLDASAGVNEGLLLLEDIGV